MRTENPVSVVNFLVRPLRQAFGIPFNQVGVTLFFDSKNEFPLYQRLGKLHRRISRPLVNPLDSGNGHHTIIYPTIDKANDIARFFENQGLTKT